MRHVTIQRPVMNSRAVHFTIKPHHSKREHSAIYRHSPAGKASIDYTHTKQSPDSTLVHGRRTSGDSGLCAGLCEEADLRASQPRLRRHGATTAAAAAICAYTSIPAQHGSTIRRISSTERQLPPTQAPAAGNRPSTTITTAYIQSISVRQSISQPFSFTFKRAKRLFECRYS